MDDGFSEDKSRKEDDHSAHDSAKIAKSARNLLDDGAEDQKQSNCYSGDRDIPPDQEVHHFQCRSGNEGEISENEENAPHNEGSLQ